MEKDQTGHPGMMGDGTEEQNLGQKGNPDARIGEDEVEQAFSAAGRTGKADDTATTGMADAAAQTEAVAQTPKDDSHNPT